MTHTEDSDEGRGFDVASVRRSALRITLVFLVVVLAALLTPGLGTLRSRLGDAAPIWLAVAVLLEAASGFSYVLMLRPIFLRGRGWWSAQRLGWSELAMGSIMPASGLTGLALGAWVLNKAGVDRQVIARQSIAFYLIKGSVNFLGVAVVGYLMFAGVGPEFSPWLTLFPAVVATAILIFIAVLPRLETRRRPPAARGSRDASPEGASAAPVDDPAPGVTAARNAVEAPAEPGDDHRSGALSRGWHSTARNLTASATEARLILARREFAVFFGAFGYWFFDNAVLWATFHAFGEQPAITVILMGYLLGQLGGLIPIPGGVGGVDGGLVGAFVIYGVPAGGAVIAVLTYRVILFWLPLLLGAVAFRALQRRLDAWEAAKADEPAPP